MKPIFFVFTLVTAIYGLPPHRRIFGGSSATPGQFPFIASLNSPEQLCDASIINKNWAITAAHCVDFAPSDSVILAGTTFQHSGGKRYPIAQMIKHENFSWTTLKDDIALIRIDGEFDFGELIQPIELGDSEPNGTCVAAGWGATQSVNYAEVLQYVQLTAVGVEDCGGLGGAFMYLGPEEVCAVGGVGNSVCNGDSGGPLICGGKLAGVVSYGTGPCGRGLPDVYVRPEAYIDWINEKIM